MNGAPDPVRAFLALEIDAGLRGALIDLIGRLRSEVPGVRWVREGALHLTLRFLGATTPANVDALAAALEGAARRCLPASASTTGLGLFPPRGAPRVVWLGLDLPSSLVDLQSACERASVEVGLARERRRFRPHVTLGRFRGRASRPELTTPALPPARFEALTLFRSELRPGGAVYTPLARLPGSRSP